jgi:SAM-dependent methyltransferase
MHRLLEKGISDVELSRVLEVGANLGEHVAFVKHPWKKYVCSDIRGVPKRHERMTLSNSVSWIKADAMKLPFGNGSFDRYIATCVLLHVDNPELMMLEARRVVRPEGLITMLLPHDPSTTYSTIRNFFLYIKFLRKRSFSLKSLHAQHRKEHVNDYSLVLQDAKKVFSCDELKLRSFPFNINLLNFNLLTVIEVRKSKK